MLKPNLFTKADANMLITIGDLLIQKGRFNNKNIIF